MTSVRVQVVTTLAGAPAVEVPPACQPAGEPDDVLRSGFVRRGLTGPELDDAMGLLRAAILRAASAPVPLRVPAARLAARLADCLCRVSPSSAPLVSIKALHLDDLVLACACVEGSAEALRLFDRRYLASVGRYLQHFDLPASMEEDVRQSLAEKLLTAVPPALPRLTAYAGFGPLEHWVSVAAKRNALTMVRRPERTRRLTDQLAEKLVAGHGGSSSSRRPRCPQLVAESLRGAIAALSPRERLLLGLRFVKGLSNQAIGVMLHVDGSTVSRWLAATRGRLFVGVRSHLAARYGPDSEVFHELVRDVASQVEASLSGLVGE